MSYNITDEKLDIGDIDCLIMEMRLSSMTLTRFTKDRCCPMDCYPTSLTQSTHATAIWSSSSLRMSPA